VESAILARGQRSTGQIRDRLLGVFSEFAYDERNKSHAIEIVACALSINYPTPRFTNMTKSNSSAHAAATDPLALDNQFCFALYSASLAMTKTYKPFLDKLGLTYPQYLVMLVLWQQDDVLVKSIGERLFLDSGTLTPLLKRLEASALIERKRDESDERQVRITLTREGRALKKKAQSIPYQVLCASGQPQEALASLRAKLAAIRDDLAANT
jgi:DNA-binding MarR family transcriptional regulator